MQFHNQDLALNPKIFIQTTLSKKPKSTLSVSLKTNLFFFSFFFFITNTTFIIKKNDTKGGGERLTQNQSWKQFFLTNKLYGSQ